jgi:arylsulfatase A-like enzyme
VSAPLVRGQATRKPNFLFLMADDHAGYVLGADGNRLAETPNLDALAAEGMRFARHYCNSPVCTPSRQGLLTGQMPHMAGVTRLPTALDITRPTLSGELKKAGYRTGVFGKMHLNRPAAPGLFGFDVMMTEGELTREWREKVKPRPAPGDVNVKPRWQPFRDPARIWLNADRLPFGRYEEEMRSTYMVRLAERFLEQSSLEESKQPFALWVSFMEPHSPYDFPIEDRNHFDPKRFTPPRVGPEDAWQIPIIFRGLSDDDKRGIIASYYTSTLFLDRNIGRVLARLRALGLDENTLVIYTADHGYNLGHHGRFEKHCGYDQALRVPLMMRWPGRVRRGVVNDFTEHIDLAATIMDMLGAGPLPVQQGRSLHPYITGKKANARDHIFSEYLENEEAFVRTDRWKFIFCSGRRKRDDGYLIDNPTPGRYMRLYDTKQDPGECTDVAAKHPDVVAKMERLMLDRFRKTHPEAEKEPQRLSREDAVEWYLRPRDV